MVRNAPKYAQKLSSVFFPKDFLESSYRELPMLAELTAEPPYPLLSSRHNDCVAPMPSLKPGLNPPGE
jgi:hypothetical protein